MPTLMATLLAAGLLVGLATRVVADGDSGSRASTPAVQQDPAYAEAVNAIKREDCFPPCEEYSDLKKAVQTYEASRRSKP